MYTIIEPIVFVYNTYIICGLHTLNIYKSNYCFILFYSTTDNYKCTMYITQTTNYNVFIANILN